MGVFTANMHTDQVQSEGSEAILASARARGVPIVSARQMLAWLDARNGSRVAALRWSGDALRFDIRAAPGAVGLRAMVPALERPVTAVRREGAPVPFTTRTLKGIPYAVFDGRTGSYEVAFE